MTLEHFLAILSVVLFFWAISAETKQYRYKRELAATYQDLKIANARKAPANVYLMDTKPVKLFAAERPRLSKTYYTSCEKAFKAGASSVDQVEAYVDTEGRYWCMSYSGPTELKVEA